ncbi:rCG20887 [Rattus norvegicus]|uniref:RCG20887 n=1 Tax=Rattus norvegicus TaxID=10116 RepID=A6JED9_RAT|nr:rCG20887 [Rattus norvegicus]
MNQIMNTKKYKEAVGGRVDRVPIFGKLLTHMPEPSYGAVIMKRLYRGFGLRTCPTTPAMIEHSTLTTLKLARSNSPDIQTHCKGMFV